MPKSDLQYYPPTDNASRPPTTQQANWQPPLPSLRSTHVQPQEAMEEVARFDAVLEKILRQKEIAGEHAARQAITRTQHEEPAKKAEAAKKAKAAKKAEAAKKTEAAKKAEAAKAETDRALGARGRTYLRATLCSHKVWWIEVPGRSRCEYHSYSKNAYRNPFRFRCPECRSIACGLCLKKLKR
ncbi:hypothetical protein BKA65DRAFT_496941 [Rhexocercosporidium sp. MPI-PUGE-AT-0058]|nr:hypothetical protein BKA65DRAFT_496941 [Rhexocercosporidium sp. MPI-PUGE-AT-0058]